MGYSTNFTVMAYPDITEDEEFQKVFQEVTDYDLEDNPFTAKWYDHSKNMIEISKRFPTVQFTVEGEGEENSDLWIAYYLNGEKEVCKAVLTFPERTLW